MFEVLNFDSSVQTTELLQSLLNGTFMSGNAFYYNDKNEKVNISYAQTFRDAGEKNQISSVHLISRVIQEQGSNGSSLSSGDNSEYPGYYNFFNINANGKTTSEVIHNGLAYAKKKGWNSPYKAIIGGASLLNDYIGPVDGHDIAGLVSILQNVRKIGGLQLVHVVTKKGKGYEPAEKAPTNTVTRNIMDLCDDTNNIYESVAIIAKRANQISHMVVC